ncbi:testis-expressed protein 10 homolog [Neocloeon triangulifer]|uniref:testis-expressed protein 10 homolog n=1 Tax=Neocloeon triangulifer TaxID=2078957 RepID=UPI00286F7696|nr:testis-expressed protein 10 homolog [Neocloeon triangulifer]
MGKNNRHQKFLKSEKAKVKLKAKKTLTKGQNVTDTSFKIKKIVIQSQLAEQADAEPVTKKKLSLKDLLSRCGHHNTSMRVEALNGLLELASSHGETLVQNLCSFVSKCAQLCIDKESAVRKESLKLLNFILTAVSAEKLEPFLSELVSYLTVGLSHLYREIQEDSLLMLDAILAAAPLLVARAAPKLLPAFLDQISIRKNSVAPERTLSMNLQSSNTSTRWRIKVLGRLHALLMASSELSPRKEQENHPRGLYLVNPTEYNIPIAPYGWEKPCIIPSIFSTGTGILVEQDLFSNADKMKGYVNVLMPLLFETWVEVGPSQRQQKEAGNLISDEASELLECILEIMQLIFQYLENASSDESLVKWFRSSFRDNFIRHIFAHFPYIQREGSSSKSNKSKGQAPFEEERVKRCSGQNLAVCLMACIFCDKPTKDQAQIILDYIKSVLDSNQNISERLVEVLEVILIERRSYWDFIGLRLEPLANSVVTTCIKQKPDLSSSPLFGLLCDLSINSMLSEQNNGGFDPIYERFVQMLPIALTKEDVPAKAMKTITTLTSALHTGILISLRTHLTPIIKNLSQICGVGMSQQETRMKVLYFLFTASVWRADILDAVGRQLVNSPENKDLLLYYLELLDYWKSNHEDSAVALKLKSMPWLTNAALEATS